MAICRPYISRYTSEFSPLIIKEIVELIYKSYDYSCNAQLIPCRNVKVNPWRGRNILLDRPLTFLLTFGPEVLIVGTWKGQQHTKHGRPLTALQVLSLSRTLPLGSFCLWLILVGLDVEAQKRMLG